MSNAYICEAGGCISHKKDCGTCGFEHHEANRRKSIPLTLCEDGLKRKILKRGTDEETNSPLNV